MGAYFIPSYCGFIDERFKDDGSYPVWPKDAVLITKEEEAEYWGKGAPVGKILGAKDGRPAWVDEPAPSREQQVADAGQKKQSLLSEANTFTQPWQTQLLLGVISDADKASLIIWMKYYQQVQAVDTSKAPDITWPVKPA